MNIKRIFGSILTVIGIFSLLYGAFVFVNASNNGVNTMKILFTYGALGLLFFVSGISLVRLTKDES